MPLYVGDYLADTRHLTTEQHGAYLLLIMHYWQHGGLPTDDAALMQICGIGGRGKIFKWRSICLAIASFFQQPGWHHKRIDAELQKSENIREKRQINGRIGGLRKSYKGPIGRVIAEANAKQMGYQSQSPIDSLPLSDSERDPKTNGHTPPLGSLATALPSGALARQASSELEAIAKRKGWAK